MKKHQFEKLNHFLADVDANGDAEINRLKKYSESIRYFILEKDNNTSLSLLLELLDTKISKQLVMMCDAFELTNFDVVVLLTLCKVIIDQNKLNQAENILLFLIEQCYFENQEMQIEVYMVMIDLLILQNRYEIARMYLNRAEIIVNNSLCNEFAKYINFYKIIIQSYLHINVEDRLEIRKKILFYSGEINDPFDPYLLINKYLDIF